MSFTDMRIMTPPTQGFVFARLGDDMVEHLWKILYTTSLIWKIKLYEFKS